MKYGETINKISGLNHFTKTPYVFEVGVDEVKEIKHYFAHNSHWLEVLKNNKTITYLNLNFVERIETTY